MITSNAQAALRLVVVSETRHARNAIARLASSPTRVRIKGETATSYYWRQARRHMTRRDRAACALEVLAGQVTL